MKKVIKVMLCLQSSINFERGLRKVFFIVLKCVFLAKIGVEQLQNVEIK